MIIDFHNHYYPFEYLDAIRDGGSHFTITTDGDDNPVLHSPGDYNVLVPGHRDLDFRQQVLDDAGVQMQVFTFTAPGTSIETPDRAVALSRVVNDALAREARDRSERFTALGTLPMNAPDAAALEAARVVGDLGLPGVMLLSNASGVPLFEERFRPVFERLDEAEAVVYIHPTYPVGVEVMEKRASGWRAACPIASGRTAAPGLGGLAAGSSGRPGEGAASARARRGPMDAARASPAGRNAPRRCGIPSCLTNGGPVANNSCRGEEACENNTGPVGKNSCLGVQACRGNSGTVGNGSCIGHQACEGNSLTIGNGDCIGDFDCD